MYLQDNALDTIFQLQSQDLMIELTFTQLKDKLVNLSRPKIPHYKAEMDISMIQQESDKPIDAYSQITCHTPYDNLPEAREEEISHRD